MLNIHIGEQTNTAGEMADLLRHIAALIDEGNTSGYHPGWTMTGDPEPACPGEAGSCTPEKPCGSGCFHA